MVQIWEVVPTNLFPGESQAMEAKKTVRVNKKALRAAARRRAAAAARLARTRLVLRDAGRPRVEKLKV